MKMDRRQFLAATIAGASGLALARHALFAETAAPAGAFELVPLGKTGIKVTRVGLGTGVRGGMRQSNMTRMGKEVAEGVMKAAYERGVRFFDVADMYGTHPLLAEALKGKPREDYVISTKMWVDKGGLPEQERPDADVVVDRFRKELNTDYLDLVLLHCRVSPTWPQDDKRQMDILAKLKEKKIIRAHGISAHSIEALKAAAATPWCDSVHARVNPYGVRMDAPPNVVVPCLKALHEAGKGVVAMKIIGEGLFRNEEACKNASVQVAMRLGCVDTMVVGFEKIEEIDDFTARMTNVMKAMRT